MRHILRVLIISSSLIYTTAAQAIACVPMPTPENPEAFFCPTFVPPIIPPPVVPPPDTTAPTIASITPSLSSTNTPYTVTVVFSEDVFGVTLEDFENLGAEILIFSNLTVVDARTYTVSVTGPDGAHRVHVINGSATDAAGNALVSPEGVDFEAAVAYDTTAPTITMTNAPLHGTSSKGPIQFEFYADDSSATFQCAFVSGASIVGATFTPCNPPDGETVVLYVPVMSVDGVYTFAVIAADELGNQRTPASDDMTLITFTYDTTLPIFSVTTPVPVVTPTVNPSFTVAVNEQTTLEFYGPCRAGTPTSIAPGTHVITLSSLPPGTYSQRETEGEGSTTLVSVPSVFMPFPEKSRYLCFFSVTDAAGNALFHTISTFTITESPIVVETPAAGGGNGPITVVTSTPTFSGESPVVIASSTLQPGNGGRVIIGQNSIVPTESTVTFSSPTFVAAGGTAPTTTSTVTVTESQPVVQQQQRRTAVRSTQRRTPRVSNKQINTVPVNQANNTPQNQTASAAAATDGLWRYLLSFFGY